MKGNELKIMMHGEVTRQDEPEYCAIPTDTMNIVLYLFGNGEGNALKVLLALMQVPNGTVFNEDGIVEKLGLSRREYEVARSILMRKEYIGIDKDTNTLVVNYNGIWYDYYMKKGLKERGR